MRAYSKKIRVKSVIPFEQRLSLKLPFFLSLMKAGFPSPADDYIEAKLDFNEYLVKHPSATFCVRVTGESMKNAGINSGDILVVDRAVAPANNKIIVAILNGEFTVKRISKNKNGLFLVPENPSYEPIEIKDEMDFEVWGVVTHVIHDLK